MNFVKIADMKWILKVGVAFKTGALVENVKFN